jgi:ribosomal protein L31
VGARGDQFAGPDLVFLAVPSNGLRGVVEELRGLGVSDAAGIVSLTKGLVGPDGTPPAVALEAIFGAQRVACVGGPAHAREMVETGAGLVCASRSEVLAHRVADTFQRSGVVCEVSDDPVGVELAGVAKNAAAVAVGATQAQGLNAAGMAAADIFLEVLALAQATGGQARTFVGRAGTGDLVATALAPSSRNRSAGELLAQGVPAAEIPDRIGQAVEALETVRLLAQALERSRLEAPVVTRAGAPDRGLHAARRLDRDGARQAAASGALQPAAHVVDAAGRVVQADVQRSATRIGGAMKAEIHPEYGPSHVRCTCGNEFWTRSTKPEMHVEICSNCHPFYTGRQKLVDTGGRVERFRRRAARAGRG